MNPSGGQDINPTKLSWANMDKLVYNIIYMPNMTDTIKRNFLVRLVHTSTSPNSTAPPGGLRPPQDKDVLAILDTCLAVAITSDTEGSLAAFGFGTWGGGYKGLLRKYLTVEKVSDVLSRGTNVILVVGWLKEALTPLAKDVEPINTLLPLLEEYLESKLREHGSVSAFLATLADFYAVCPALLPPQSMRPTFTVSIMKCVASFPTPTKPEVLGHMKSVGGLVNTLWNSLQLEDILNSLNAMYTIISNTDGRTEVCPAMAHLLSLVPTQVVEALAPRIVSQPPAAPDPALHATLTRLTTWLVTWPTAYLTMGLWVRTLARLLYEGGRTMVPARVTLDRVPKLMMALKIPVVREGVVSVLSTLLLSFQHSPVAFHKIIPALVDIMAVLEREGSASSNVTLPRLATLTHSLMALHPGHPDTYQPLMEALKKYPVPSEDEIQRLIQEHRWASSEVNLRSGSVLSGQLRGVWSGDGGALGEGSGGVGGYHQRPHSQKAGLRNLGNTCYMNSVIQALFMTDNFRYAILHASPRSNQQLLVRLQHLLALLCFTHRPHVAPRLFHDKSRPSWFSPGAQQDCSEYLRHLMSTLHEEEGAGQSLPEYQERVIIESETASLASCDLQPLPYDFPSQTNDPEEFPLEADFRGGPTEEAGESSSKQTKAEDKGRRKKELVPDLNNVLDQMKDEPMESVEEVKKDINMQVQDKKADDTDNVHGLDKGEPMEGVDSEVVKDANLSRKVKREGKVKVKKGLDGDKTTIKKIVKEEPMDVDNDLSREVKKGIKVKAKKEVEKNNSNVDKLIKDEPMEGVNRDTHKEINPLASESETGAGSGTEAKAGLSKRKYNTSPDTAPRHTLKSPKGEMTPDLDNSSDSGISGDLAEEQISSPIIPGSPVLSHLQAFQGGGGAGLTIEEVEGSQWCPENEYFVSLVHKVFGGKLATCIKCLQCKTESIHKDVFTDIHLAFEDPQHPPDTASSKATRKNPSWEMRQRSGGEGATAELSIEDLITGYLTSERLTGENQYECDRCGGKRDAERSIQILEPPLHLILTQLRFYYDTARAHRQKVFTNVDFGEELWLPIRHSTQGKSEEDMSAATAVRVSGLSSDSTSEHRSDVIVRCGMSCEVENSNICEQEYSNSSSDQCPTVTQSDEQPSTSGVCDVVCSEEDSGRMDVPRRAPGEGVGSGGAGWYSSPCYFSDTENSQSWQATQGSSKTQTTNDKHQKCLPDSESERGIQTVPEINRTNPDSLNVHKAPSSPQHPPESAQEVEVGADEEDEGGEVRYARYALYGVVVHSGFSSEGGHYYCYARSSSLAALPPTARESYGALGGWFNFNDERVTSTTFPAISSLTRTFTRDTAYQLFYRRLSDSLVPDVPLEENLCGLRLDLQEAVEGDNLLYRSEQSRSNLHHHLNHHSRSHFPPPDPDDPGAPPPGGCGAGPGGGSFNTTSRVVF